MRPGVVAVLVSASLLVLGAAPGGGPAPGPLPERMADTGGGGQLITALAPDTGSTTGTVTWWDHVGEGEAGGGDRWVRAGSAPARFGSGGLTAGTTRVQGTSTTPTGLYDLPYAFGIEAAPRGTAYRYRPVRQDSWWCQDNASRSYNRWTEPRPADCRATEAEHLITYPAQYAHALVVGFNYHRPVRGRGAGIFLHVNGRGATAGCVSVPKDAMRRILRWAKPKERPHIAIGTSAGATAITRY
ncbi:L,D-transpeptidase [Streptomyces sp. AC512_CC834]|uniref:L,D-transpeptidase family protein n=1 Tax=Streptomyces sp. AC512_CC834 TaxID=2823691 RepID=UPI001C259443|nr:L,D-transpeptidase family protein [Streptomyces sp. AC512_CC834]